MSSVGKIVRGGRRRRGRQGPASTIAVHYVDNGRRAANLTLPLMTALFIVSLVVPWWQLTLDSATGVSDVHDPAQIVIIGFALDGAVSCASTNWLSVPYAPCSNLSVTQSELANLTVRGMGGALGLLVGAGALASVLATAGSLGYRRRRWPLRLEIALTAFCVFGALVLAASYVAVGVTPAENSACWYLSADATTCGTLFGGTTSVGFLPGECEGCQNRMGWAPTTGFFVDLIAAGVGAATLSLLWVRRHGPYTIEEEAVWSVRHKPADFVRPAPAAPPPASVLGPPAPSVIWSRPPIEATHSRFRIAEAPWTCPRCQRENSRYALVCSDCLTDRPPD
jgi:hypothetical protein